MSRNIRRKAAAPPRRKNRRDSTSSSSSLDLSSDGGYSALEDLSDDEDDDEDGVDATEEQYIIKDVVKNRHARSAPRSEDEPAEEPEEEDDDEDEDESDGAVIKDDEEAEEGDEEDDDEPDDDDEEADDLDVEWNGITTESETNAAGGAALPKRQVRFAGVPDSDSDSTTTELSQIAAEFFPDIFVEQNSLDPSFRREIEEESDSTVSSSFWDYASAYEHGGGNGGGASLNVPYSDDDLILPSVTNSLLYSASGTPLTPVAEQDEEGADASDGYETDGDTTEEEDLEELPARRKPPRRVQSIDGESSDSGSEPDVSVRHRRGHPRVGRFIIDTNSSKPIAVMHPVTGKMVIFTPEKPRPIRHQYDVLSDALPASALDLLPPQPHADLDLTQSSPLITNSASVMMGAMFSSHTFGDYMHSQNVGPVEAFFPAISSDAFLGDESDDYSGELLDDDGEMNLRLEDFIQFERSISDGSDLADGAKDKAAALQSETDGNDANAGDDGNDETPVATPLAARHDSFTTGLSSVDDDEDDEVGGGAAPSVAASSMPPLLAHFDKNADAVGAFRRNQIDQQLIYSNKATAESLAFSGPYLMGTLRGIKSGSLEAVATPITPPRRRKHRSSMSVGSFHTREEYIRSPLSAVVQKRKAPGAPSDQGGGDHKRQRSISEVKDLAL